MAPWSASLMGILAWELANAPEPVGRRLTPTEAEALLKSSGLEGTKRMVYAGSPR